MKFQKLINEIEKETNYYNSEIDFCEFMKKSLIGIFELKHIYYSITEYLFKSEQELKFEYHPPKIGLRLVNAIMPQLKNRK